tara:strand:+ start:330 stop:1106 length:777 start_codon:yes stop_codon:yes gene_type:complete
MDWLPQIVVKAEDSVSLPTSVSALKTFATGFPDTKATVHCIGLKAHDFCKQWCDEGGHTLLNYPSTVKTSQLHYQIVKRTRLPVAIIAGTTVFYDVMSDYSTTKLFGADTIPEWNLTDTVVNVKSIEKTIIFVAKPIEVIETLDSITQFTSSDVAAESPNGSKWGTQTIIMDGKIYHQTSGIFNMLYNFDSSLFTNFSSKTANKYETVFGGNAVSSTMKKLEATGHDTNSFMPYINAAMNEDWEGVKGYRKVFIDSIS